jgi:methylene-fatty-acyl-phospholipid synthase
VFLVWCAVFGDGALWPPAAPLWAVALGVGLIAVGQALSASVFRRLGPTGVFYGSAFGYELRWHDEFPFNLIRHPQYVGAVLSIWGFFLVLRFPAPDWFALPLLETGYYVIGMRFER